MRKPNILWICTDQQRFDALGCYGNGQIHTPNLDELARGGIRFDKAFCQNPVCTPSRSSFMTGRYPRTVRSRQNGQSIPANEVLITRILADAGYNCGLAGKLHLSACHPSVGRMERRIDDGYTDFHWSHHPAHIDNRRQLNVPANAYSRWLNEKGLEYHSVPTESCAYVQTSMAEEHHYTTWCVEKAISFIDMNRHYDHPWMFSLNFFDPHNPFNPPDALIRKYLSKLEAIPLPDFVEGELENKPDHHRYYHTEISHPYATMNEHDHRMIRAAYWAMVELIDKQLGRLFSFMKQKGQWDNTLIVFMSDHGEMLGDHGVYLKGPFFYEPAIRVPLILSGSGLAQTGKISKALVELVDLAPTLLEWIGLEPHSAMQGRSLWPILSGERELHKHRNDIYCEYYNSNSMYRTYATMLRTDEHKLIRYHNMNDGELYDLKGDPAERHNLWSDPEYVEVKMELLCRLSDRMAFTVDPLPDRVAEV